VLTFSTFTEDSSADATGTATWARIEDSDGVWVMDMDVGTSVPDPAPELIMNTTSITAGGPIRIDSGSLTAGNA